MGYTTYPDQDDFITVDPPVSWSSLKALKEEHLAYEDGDYKAYSCEVGVVITTEEQETKDGILAVKLGTRITVPPIDDYRGYNVESELKKLIFILDANHHKTSGTLNFTGENGDRWRLVVTDNKVIREDAKYIWPDGTTEVIRV